MGFFCADHAILQLCEAQWICWESEHKGWTQNTDGKTQNTGSTITQVMDNGVKLKLRFLTP